MLDKLKSFQIKEKSIDGDILQAGVIIRQVLVKVKNILENHGEYDVDIEALTKDMLTRAMMLDIVFNHLYELVWGDDSRALAILKEDNDLNELYYHTPAIGVFFNGVPVFLNRNYVKALGASDVDTLKQEIVEGKVLEKYYTPESQAITKAAILKLASGEGYKDLRLTTVGGKTISWNSFGKRNGLEIRIGNDITHGVFRNSEVGNSTKDDCFSLKTKQLVNRYITEVGKIIHLDSSYRTKLIVFAILSEILDKIWNDGQFLMNVTIEKDEKGEKQMICNNNYLNAVGLTFEELKEKVKKNTLYTDHYSKDTEKLIKGLWETLKEDGYYVFDFVMLDKNRVPKNYSWYRTLIVDKDLGVYRTFGIGNSAISKSTVEIRKLLGENNG